MSELHVSRDEIIEIRQRHRANIPDLHNGAYRRLWDKAMSGKSLRAAVKAKCQDCMAWQATEIKLCTCAACPLFPYRPGVKRASTSARRRPVLRATTHATHTSGAERPEDGQTAESLFG